MLVEMKGGVKYAPAHRTTLEDEPAMPHRTLGSPLNATDEAGA